MSKIATKLAAVIAIAQAAGLDEKAARHLIHGVGGSPRRAAKALKAGSHEMWIAAYEAALDEGLAHAAAVIRCNEMWLAAHPRPEQAEDEPAAEPAAEVAA